MQYIDFETIMSEPRMRRYLRACGNNTRKAMTLYRYNLRLSQECFTIISCFEIALRNAIDAHCTAVYGNHWIRDSHMSGGIFDNPRCRRTKTIIRHAYSRLRNYSRYSHSKLVAELDFGFWRYLFAQPQFFAAGQSLLTVFPNKPRSTPQIQYNHAFVFGELGIINKFRNRIAHHEPVCFQLSAPIIDTTNVMQGYNVIQELFAWMNIDSGDLLFGLDHIQKIVDQINDL